MGIITLNMNDVRILTTYCSSYGLQLLLLLLLAVVDEKQSPMRGTLLGVHHSIFFVIVPLPIHSVFMFYLPIPPPKNS